MCGFEACNSYKPGLLNALPVERYEATNSCFDIYEILPPLLLFLLHNTHKKSCKFKYKSGLHPCGVFFIKNLHINNDEECDIYCGQGCHVEFRIWTADSFESDG
jgi:hypothetical protein